MEAFRLGMEADPPLCSRVLEDHLRDAFLTDHARLFFVIACHLGLRSGEIVRLRWDQVGMEKKVVRLEADQGEKACIARFTAIYSAASRWPTKRR